MKSKFAIKSYLAPFLALILVFAIILIIPEFFRNPYYNDKLFPKIFVPSLLIFSFIAVVFGELRTKFIIIEIEESKIIVKRFFGLKTERYKISEIVGWKYSFLPSRVGTYEYLYLYKNNKKIVKLSEFYHKNYIELKKKIETNFKNLGFEEFSYIDEFKEIFM